jgi:hypothetical protein
VKAIGHAFQPEINKHQRRQALGGGAIDQQGGSDGGMYIPAAAGPKGGRETDRANNISPGENKL